MFFFFLILPLFEGIKDHAIRPFDLAVGSWMSNGDVFDGDAMVFAEVPKVMASKCSSEGSDDVVRETKSVDDIFEELDCLFCSSRDERFILNPLGELINGNIYVLEATWRWLERPNHIQSLACKGPRSWDGLQLLCRHMYLPGEKLASFTTLDEVFCVGDDRGPVKTSSESFADQVSRGHVVAVGT